MPITATFRIDIYDITVTVTFDNNWRDKAQKQLIAAGDKDLDDLKDTGALALRVPRGKGVLSGVFLYFDEKCERGIIYHECFHALLFIAETKGLEIDINIHEPLAYLSEYLIKNVINIYKGDKKCQSKKVNLKKLSAKTLKS